MTKYLRSTTFAATVALALAGTQASAAPVGAGTPATGRAEIVKGLTLTATSNLDLGKIVVWGNGTITMDTAGGIVCTTGALTCDPTGTAATYRVTGIPTLNVYQNGEVVKQIVGARPKSVLLNELAEFIG